MPITTRYENWLPAPTKLFGNDPLLRARFVALHHEAINAAARMGASRANFPPSLRPKLAGLLLMLGLVSTASAVQCVDEKMTEYNRSATGREPTAGQCNKHLYNTGNDQRIPSVEVIRMAINRIHQSCSIKYGLATQKLPLRECTGPKVVVVGTQARMQAN